METFTNIQEANQRIGALGVELKTEKEARAAVLSDLETAKAAHSTELEKLQTKHSEELANLKGENAKTVTELNDKLAAATEENEKLKAEAKTADEKAADIVSTQGGAPVEAEQDESANAGPRTAEQTAALWEEYNAIPSTDVQGRREFYKKNLRPQN